MKRITIKAPASRLPRSLLHSLLQWSLLLSLLLALAACAPSGPQLRPDEQATNPERLAEAGRHAEAADAWLALSAEQPARADQARIAAARQWLEAGELAEARALIAQLREVEMEPAMQFRVALLGAELALAERDFDTAERILSRPREQVPPALRERFDTLNQRLAENNPDSPAARVAALQTALAEDDFRPEMALALLLELPLGTLNELASVHRGQVGLAPWLDLAVVARGRLLDDAALQPALADWRRQYGLEPGVDAELFEWIRTWRQTRPMPKSVAVLLPGEGALARAGRVLREGLLAAWLELPRDRRPALDFHYVGNAETDAANAWFEARKRGSEFVIGPLMRSQIAPLLRLPDDAGLPTLLLNRPPAGATMPDSVRPLAMLALPPEEEAELAAVRALVNEFDRALIVAQRSDFGDRVVDRFAETFELGGGRVMARVEYVPGEFDHTEALENLLQIDASRERAARLQDVLGAEIESEPQRRTDFDVVFLAARGGDARQIMPQLKFFEIQPRPVYATSDVWPGENAGRDLDGIQFPAAPWLLQQGEPAERRRRAERMYPDLAGSPTASTLYALGRDALALVPWMAPMKRDPELYLAGNVGRLRLTDGVVLERDLPWARVEDGRPVRHEPEAGD
ncbi:MAG: penicillin-binding protein activator [Wenzhouxiangellaceae bacterium]